MWRLSRTTVRIRYRTANTVCSHSRSFLKQDDAFLSGLNHKTILQNKLSNKYSGSCTACTRSEDSQWSSCQSHYLKTEKMQNIEISCRRYRYAHLICFILLRTSIISCSRIIILICPFLRSWPTESCRYNIILITQTHLDNYLLSLCNILAEMFVFVCSQFCIAVYLLILWCIFH